MLKQNELHAWHVLLRLVYEFTDLHIKIMPHRIRLRVQLQQQSHCVLKLNKHDKYFSRHNNNKKWQQLISYRREVPLRHCMTCLLLMHNCTSHNNHNPPNTLVSEAKATCPLELFHLKCTSIEQLQKFVSLVVKGVNVIVYKIIM